MQKLSLVCGSLRDDMLCFENKESCPVLVEKKKQRWSWWSWRTEKAWAEKLSLGEKETKERCNSLRLQEAGLEIRVVTQPRDRQTWEPGTANRPQAGRGRWRRTEISEERKSTRSKGRERPGTKAGLIGQDKAASWGLDGRVGAQWVVFPFRDQFLTVPLLLENTVNLPAKHISSASNSYGEIKGNKEKYSNWEKSFMQQSQCFQTCWGISKWGTVWLEVTRSQEGIFPRT